jgi:sRNA-binding regulator protein Hfq
MKFDLDEMVIVIELLTKELRRQENYVVRLKNTKNKIMYDHAMWKVNKLKNMIARCNAS